MNKHATRSTQTLVLLSIFTLTLLIPAIRSQTYTHPTDVSVMQSIASSYPSTFGSLPRWSATTDPCTSGPENTADYLNPWSGIQCDVINATAENLYRVVGITLRHYGFKTQVLRGPFPTPIGQLPRVSFVDLSFNGLHGTIPDFVSTNLVSLDLSMNNLTGSIPASFSSLSTLRILRLENNLLGGTVPRLPTLSVLRLGRNSFTGRISDFVTNFTQLTTLALNSNNFYGPIPTFPIYSNLYELYLQDNDFSGSIPGTLSYQRSLASVDLSNNRLTGAVPSFKNSTSVVSIVLACNQLSGTIPVELGTLPNLRILRLEVNNLTGLLPEFLQDPPVTPIVAGSGGNIPIFFNASCNFFSAPLPLWCNRQGTNSSACVPCMDSERQCYFKFVPWIPGGDGDGDGDGDFSSPASRPLSFFLSFLFALWDELISSLYRL